MPFSILHPAESNFVMEGAMGWARTDVAVVDSVPAKGAIFTGCFLASLQALDGIFTSIGINRYGLGIEGNPLLRVVMEEFGHIPTLAFLKLLAILIIVLLTVISARMPWVKGAMGAVSLVYLVAAIVPWTYILFVKDTL